MLDGYFPLEYAPPESTLAAHSDWYAETLQSLAEHPLANIGRSHKHRTVLRFSSIPTFSQVTILRVWGDHHRFQGVLKMSDGSGGYPPLKLAREWQFTLAVREWQQYLAWIDDPALWIPRPYWKRGEDGEEYATLDGNSWIAEYSHQDKVMAASEHGGLDEVWSSLAVWLRDEFARIKRTAKKTQVP